MESLPPATCKVYTPRALANAMAAAISDDVHVRWLEPCVGSGVFLEALRDLGIPAGQVVALDIERDGGATDCLANTVRGVDFIAWTHETSPCFDRIIGNPPFVPIGRLPESLRKVAVEVKDPFERCV